MTGSYGAEAIKVTRRVSTWVMAAIWVLFPVVFLYLLPFAFVSSALSRGQTGAAQSFGEAAPFLLPENFVSYVVGFMFSSLGTAIALILGALAAGSEYGWGTMKMILSQYPSRLSVLSGKLLVLASLLATLTVAALIAGAVLSFGIALLTGSSTDGPGLLEIPKGLGAGFLLLAVWASLGYALATLFKGSALAVGLGLIYTFAIEPTLALILSFNEDLRGVAQVLPTRSASALIQALGGGSPAAQAPFPGLALDAPYAVLALCLYTAAFLILTALLFVRRDVS